MDKHDIGPPKEVQFFENGYDKHEANCDVYIEDAPHYGQALQDAGLNVLMPKRRYNDTNACQEMRKTAEEILDYAKAVRSGR